MRQYVQQSSVCLSVSGNRLPQPDSRGAFVINLGSSSTPVALSSPEHPELKKFTFFVSRRREDGRERFRLHMGYFESQQDAEALLEIVREVYPSAWAGVGPGRRQPSGVPASTPPSPVDTPRTAIAPPALDVARAEPLAAPVPPIPVMELHLELEPAPPTLADEHFAAEQSLSSVRAAIASLEDNRLPDPVQKAPVLSPTQTLVLLESTASTPTKPPPPPAVPTPDSVAAYAVQLRWSTQPIGMSELPPLAIFDAYTLYRAKGRHQGAHWHALRLGFFHDQVSADQVASYIRPEFGEVTVVPVGSAERDSATTASATRLAAARPASAPATTPGAGKGAASAVRPNAARTPAPADDRSSSLTGQFKLIEDDVRPSAEPSRLEMMLTSDVAASPTATGAARAAATAAAPGKETKRRPPANLEETLDVLGAGNLKLDGAKGEMLDASGVRRMRHAAERKPQARSPLSRLFDRLAERIGGGR